MDPDQTQLPERVFQSVDEHALKDERLFRELADYLNGLALHDFEKLVQLLYRVDVSEMKLRKMLQDKTGSDVGELIAALMIERQIQKIRSRKDSGSNFTEESGEEKW